MSINTGVLAVAELQYGFPDEALERLRVMTDTLDLHMPGAISEMLPDYGCFVQAWSSFAVAWPVIAHMFGLRPRVNLRSLHVNPCMPTSWRGAALSNVLIGDTRFDFSWDGETMHVGCDSQAWSVASESVPLRLERRETIVGSSRRPA